MSTLGIICTYPEVCPRRINNLCLISIENWRLDFEFVHVMCTSLCYDEMKEWIFKYKHVHYKVPTGIQLSPRNSLNITQILCQCSNLIIFSKESDLNLNTLLRVYVKKKRKRKKSLNELTVPMK